MRHAKSDYPLGVADHDRPLNRRGRLAAALMGAYLREAAMMPDLAFVSTAARAQETWARMGLGAASEARPGLYHASAETALETAGEAPADVQTLLLLWHQPGIRDAANRMIGAHEVHQFPTAQIVALSFDVGNWSEIDFGRARLLDIAAPKALV